MKKKHFPIKLVCVCPLENLINTFTSNFQVFLLFLMVKCVYNNCCQQKTVAGMGDLDGVYNLLGDKPDEVDVVCQVDLGILSKFISDCSVWMHVLKGEQSRRKVLLCSRPCRTEQLG